MFEVVFLGTSASAPSVNRGLSSSLIIYKEHRFLIDCGEGTQRQILRSGLGFKRLDKILLTHDHLDHILGLGGLASTLSRWEAIDHIRIYGGARTIDRVRKLLFQVVFPGNQTPFNLDLITLQSGLLFEDSSFYLTTFPVTHRGTDSFGFIFQEKSRRRFLNEKAEALQIPIGPQRRMLVSGQAVTLTDGRLIEPDEVLGPEIAGTKLVYVGDTGRIDNLIEPAREADALIIEATYLQEDAAMADQFSHLTAGQAAQLARAANVGQLYLTHLSRRYREQDILAEAQAIFPNTTVVHDLDHVQVAKPSQE